MTHDEPTNDPRAGVGPQEVRPERGFVLRVPADASSVAIARSVVRRTVRFETEDLASRYNTAFTEILINAIEAQQQLSEAGDVIIVAELTDRPMVTVINQRNGVEDEWWHRPTTRSVDFTHERGRGLLIATSLVPATEIVVDETTVIVTLPLLGFGAAT